MKLLSYTSLLDGEAVTRCSPPWGQAFALQGCDRADLVVVLDLPDDLEEDDSEREAWLLSRCEQSPERVVPTLPRALWREAVAAMGDLRTEAPYSTFMRGAKAIARAKAAGCATESDCELIDAVAQFYHLPEERTHDMRLVYLERSLSRSRQHCPDDAEIARWHDRASKAAFARATERAEAAYFRLAQP